MTAENNLGAGSRGTKKRRFNLFDLIVLIVVVALAFGAYLFLGRSEGAAAGTAVKVTYQVEITHVREQIKDSATVGDPVIDAVKRYRLGTLTRVNVLPQEEIVANRAQQTLIETRNPYLYKVQLTIEADGMLRDGQVTVDGATILVGGRMSVRTAHFSGTGYCISMTTE
jgi:hypothetical protein